jgi:gamma-glutamylcyclotransferase (GGCT)/AIG2-like uncharacterized protein YtfP
LVRMLDIINTDSHFKFQVNYYMTNKDMVELNGALVDAEQGAALPPADSTEAPIFVYGSLLCEEVRETLLGRSVEVRAGMLEGYRRHRIRDESYPGISKCDLEEKDGEYRHSAVAGELLFGLSNAERSILNEFEDDEYILSEVPVRQLGGEGATVKAWAYVWNGANNLLLDEDWQLNQFYGVEPHWGDFLQMCRDFKVQHDAAGAASRLKLKLAEADRVADTLLADTESQMNA